MLRHKFNLQTKSLLRVYVETYFVLPREYASSWQTQPIQLPLEKNLMLSNLRTIREIVFWKFFNAVICLKWNLKTKEIWMQNKKQIKVQATVWKYARTEFIKWISKYICFAA